MSGTDPSELFSKMFGGNATLVGSRPQKLPHTYEYKGDSVNHAITVATDMSILFWSQLSDRGYAITINKDQAKKLARADADDIFKYICAAPREILELNEKKLLMLTFSKLYGGADVRLLLKRMQPRSSPPTFAYQPTPMSTSMHPFIYECQFGIVTINMTMPDRRPSSRMAMAIALTVDDRKYAETYPFSSICMLHDGFAKNPEIVFTYIMHPPSATRFAPDDKWSLKFKSYHKSSPSIKILLGLAADQPGDAAMEDPVEPPPYGVGAPGGL